MKKLNNASWKAALSARGMDWNQDKVSDFLQVPGGVVWEGSSCYFYKRSYDLNQHPYPDMDQLADAVVAEAKRLRDELEQAFARP